MSGPRDIDAVVFDYGGVLTTPVRHSIASWLAREEIDPASFSGALRAWLSRSAPEGTPIHRLETGEIGVEEFDRLLAAELVRYDGRPVDPVGVLGRLFADLRPDEEVYRLVGELRDAGIRVAMLSNSWGSTYPRPRIDELFDPLVISSEVGLRKPHAAIFRLTVERLRLPPERVLMLDDAEPNVEGARAAGLQALLHTDAASTRARLARLLPSLSPTSPARPARPTTNPSVRRPQI